MIFQNLNTELSVLELKEFDKEFVSASNLNYAYKKDDEITSGINLSVALDQADVVFLFTREIYKRQGFAHKFFLEVIDDLKKKGIKKLFLEVDENNIPAIELYKKLNFKKINIRKKYYANGNDAVVMEREL